MQAHEILHKRWNPAWDEAPTHRLAGEARGYALTAWDALSKVSAKRKELEEQGHLSAKGLQERQRELLANEVIPALRRSAHGVGRAREQLAVTRQTLTVQKPDPTDLAGALRRWELREWLRGLNDASKALTHLLDENASSDLLAAAFEMRHEPKPIAQHRAHHGRAILLRGACQR